MCGTYWFKKKWSQRFRPYQLLSKNKLKKRINASACTVFLSTFLQLWLEKTSCTIGRYVSEISANLLNVFAMFIEWQDSMNFLGAAFLNLPKTFAFFQLMSWLRLETCWKIMEVSALCILYLCCSMRERLAGRSTRRPGGHSRLNSATDGISKNDDAFRRGTVLTSCCWNPSWPPGIRRRLHYPQRAYHEPAAGHDWSRGAVRV